MGVEFCPHCDASLREGVRFCSNCGEETLASKRATRLNRRATNQRSQASAKAITWVVAGSLAAMVLWYLLVDDLFLRLALTFATDAGICLLAARRLGDGALGQSLGRRPDALAWGLGLLIPCLSLPIAWGYVAGLQALFDPGGTTEFEDPLQGRSLPLLLLCIAVLPALVEEWMCRGVLWIALRPIAGRWLTIFSTASLFAILHGLNGGFTIELPHRFAMGLMLGWLRAKTGSLWPCVLAHFLHNAVAVVAMD